MKHYLIGVKFEENSCVVGFRTVTEKGNSFEAYATVSKSDNAIIEASYILKNSIYKESERLDAIGYGNVTLSTCEEFIFDEPKPTRIIIECIESKYTTIVVDQYGNDLEVDISLELIDPPTGITLVDGVLQGSVEEDTVIKLKATCEDLEVIKYISIIKEPTCDIPKTDNTLFETIADLQLENMELKSQLVTLGETIAEMQISMIGDV